MRRFYGAAVRAAYANARRMGGLALRQKEPRDPVKARFSHLNIADAWLLHCATLVGMDLRNVAQTAGSCSAGGRKWSNA